jgi:hypothetical protein
VKSRKADFGFDVKVLARRGQAYYDQQLRPGLESQHYGRFVAVEPDTMQYWIADSVEDVCRQARAALPGKFFHLIRIGFVTAHTARCLRH